MYNRIYNLLSSLIMAINFPSSIDSLTNPISSNTLDNPSHAGQHSDANDAIEALETKVGVDSSAVSSSIDYKLTNTSSSNPGHKHTLVNGATDVTASAAELNQLDGVSVGGTSSGDIATIDGTQTLTNKTISTSDNVFPGMLDWFYPVGTIYETTSADLDTTTKMNTHFGGTWEVYGSGRVLVAKSADTEFDALGETGGEKTHTLTESEMPKHTHVQNSHNHTQGSHTHTQSSHSHGAGNLSGFTVYQSGGASRYRLASGSNYYAVSASSINDIGYSSSTASTTASNNSTTATNNATTATNQNTGGDGAHNNLQPYIVVYRYRRTA